MCALECTQCGISDQESDVSLDYRKLGQKLRNGDRSTGGANAATKYAQWHLIDARSQD